jgi:hypothetical protein
MQKKKKCGVPRLISFSYYEQALFKWISMYNGLTKDNESKQNS